MSSWSNELKVGLLTLAALVAAAWGVLRTDDRPEGAIEGYDLYVLFPSAEGVYPTTQVRVAGVSVGSVRKVTLEGTQARLHLEIAGHVKLPVDSVGELRTEGVLGDKFIRITPGTATQLLQDEDLLPTRATGPDLEALQADAAAIAGDVRAITASLRTTIEDPALRERIHHTLENVDRASADLSALSAEARKADLAAAVADLRALTASIQQAVERTGAGVDQEIAALRTATDRLDRTLAGVESVVAKVDAGEGTLGRIVNDDGLVRRVEHTLDDVQGVVDSVTAIRTEVYYEGAAYLGTDPSEADFLDNPVAGSARHAVGLRLMPREDYGYLVELVDHPYGDITWSEHSYDGTDARYREYVRTPDYRFSLQFLKRWRNVGLRFGLKDSTGGVGADTWMLRDRLLISADLYDFTTGSWPVLDGTPNLSLALRATPYPHLLLWGGLDNLIFGLRHGYVTGFVGGGFRFDDDDLKWVLGTLPFPG